MFKFFFHIVSDSSIFGIVVKKTMQSNNAYDKLVEAVSKMKTSEEEPKKSEEEIKIGKQEDVHVEPLQITGMEKQKDGNIYKVFVNRLPIFSDFVWEKFYNLPGADVIVAPGSESKVDFFFLVGTNEELKMQIVYFIQETNQKVEDPIILCMKDGSPLVLDHHHVALNIGVNQKWIGNKKVCYAEQPGDPDFVCEFYLY